MIQEPRLGPGSWADQAWKLLLRIALAAMLVYVAYRLRYVAVIVTLAIVLALALQPLVERVVNRIPPCRISRQGCRILAALGVFIGLALLFMLAGLVLFQPFHRELSHVANQVPVYVKQIEGYVDQASDWYTNLPKDVQDTIRKQDFSNFARTIGLFIGGIIRSTLMWLSLGWELILIPVLAFYFVVDYRTLKREFVFLVGPSRRREALRILHEVGQITQSYVVGQLILCLIAGIVVWVFLLIGGVKYALTLAVLAGITRAIPIIGPIVGGIPIVGMAMLQSWKTGLWVLCFFAILHLVESKLIMPKLIGHRMHLHAAVVIIALLIGSEFFGVLGMFLAAPVAAIIKVLLNHYVISQRPTIRPPRGRGGRDSEALATGKESVV